MHTKTYFVYILKCADDSYYTGITNNLDRRLAEHNSGFNPECYTASRRPVELAFAFEFKYVDKAIAFEKQVKGWSRKKKEAIIRDNWEALKDLAKCVNGTHWREKGLEK
ncbi:GIY-YIG nuclease family protein [Dyadobacter pollutisoli]|jgi:putative endonuclease|uniref:GIY-YIG nuclease family protein n=1 Tax=Dyadobacter pollutisoli TaxID=2910158 RepID=A0A9E8N7V0_9BACT|nr:GIY-YIG nuclease family protein [Dyadobacter pollutisoli]WAC11515.1 GIY-YIG nuclease family protein [Dyadobacter pollutisoli]